MIFVLIVVLVLVSYLRRYICKHFSILDKPGPDVPKRDRVPTIQGVGVLLCMLGGLAVLSYAGQIENIFHPSLRGLYAGVGLLFLVSLSDELGRIVSPKLRVSSKLRLGVQILSGFLAWKLSSVGIFQLNLPWGDIIFADWMSVVVTIGRFVLYMNAINRFDGVYGLATGVSTVGFWTVFGLLSLVVFPSYALIDPEQIRLLSMAQEIAFLMGLIGLIYLSIEYKPRGLLRDIGTVLMGFLLAYLSLLGGAKIGSMIVVLALPLFDAAWVIVDRLRQRKNPMQGDYTHLHYRLMALGRNRHEVRRFIWGYSMVMMVLMLLQGTARMGKVIIFVMMFVIFFGVNVYLFWIKKLPSVYKPELRKDNNET